MGALCMKPSGSALLASDDARDSNDLVTEDGVRGPDEEAHYGGAGSDGNDGSGGGGSGSGVFGGHKLGAKGKAILAKNKVLDLARSDKHGMLLKRSKYKNEWVPRFVVLRGGMLFSCRKEGDEPNLVLLVNEAAQLSRGGAYNTWSSAHSEQKHTFTVSDNQGQTWPLAFQSNDELESWWLGLKEWIDRAQLRKQYATELQAMLIAGQKFKKYHHSRLGALAGSKRAVERVVRIDEECTVLLWLKDGSEEYCDIPFREITEVVPGAETPAFKGTNASTANCFSVVSVKRTLDLEAENAQVRDDWVKGLNAAIRFGHVATDLEVEAQADAAALERAKLKADGRVKERRASRAKLKALVAANSQTPASSSRSFRSSGKKDSAKFSKLF